MWEKFLHSPSIFSRPFIDFSTVLAADRLDMFSDASKNPELGFGAICGASWLYGKWNPELIRQEDPSIEYLELYVLVMGFLAWGERLKNRRILLFCDNMSVVEMVNRNSSTCKNFMILIRLLVLKSLAVHARVFARHVSGKSNFYSDALSHLQFQHFWTLSAENGKTFEDTPTDLPSNLYPMENVWSFATNN